MLNTSQLAKRIFRGTMSVLAITCLTGVALAQGYRFNPEHRRPVEATINDLQMIETRNAYTGNERERYDNALKHLTQFADRLHEGGYFDKDKLDQCIGDVQGILDHNRIHEHARELLTHDVSSLRELRQHFDDARYRYH